MKKIILIFILILISIITFSFGYDELLKKALEFSWEGEYSKAENLFSQLLEDYKTEELIIAYSNTLAWQGKYQEAIKIIEDSNIETPEVLETKAKIYFWAKDYKAGVEIIEKLKSNNINISADLQKLYSEYKNFRFNYLFMNYNTELASTSLESDFSTIYKFNNRNIYKIGLSINIGLKNYSYDTFSMNINYSKDKIYTFLGLSDKQYYFAGIEYYMDNLFFGFSNSIYRGYNDLNFTLNNQGLIGYNFNLNNFIFTFKPIVIYNKEFYNSYNKDVFRYYINASLSYKDALYLNYFFNFKDINNINGNYKFDMNSFYIRFNSSYDFIYKNYLLGAGIEFNF